MPAPPDAAASPEMVAKDHRPPLRPESPLTSLPGVGPKRSAALSARGLSTVSDLLFYLPTRYEDWRDIRPVLELAPGTVATVHGRLGGLRQGRMRGRGRRLITGWLQDSAGTRIDVVWFNAPGYMHELLSATGEVVMRGRVAQGAGGRPQMLHPEVLPAERTPAILPCYPAGDEIGQRLMRGLMERVLPAAALIADPIPREIRPRLQVMALAEALQHLHRPPPDADVAQLMTGASAAQRTLAISEMFVFQTALMVERRRNRERPAIVFNSEQTLSDRFLTGLPFMLTASQQRAIAELSADMRAAQPMNRLLLGDVGSGKTVVALWAVLRAIEHGYQAAVMAPTELLAEQHLATFNRLCRDLNVPAILLSAKVTGAERRQGIARAAAGEPIAIFGTHALIQRQVRIARLGLAVIDEQHRFGVFDRMRLMAAGPRADMLLMSATPIPRSLARVMLSNLDLTLLDEMPPGRAPVTTRLVSENELDPVWEMVREEARRSRQAYIILPLIESEDEQELAVETAAGKLAEGPLHGLAVGVMHGRLSAADKEAAMRRFRDGKLQVLIATTVVEVGIDVPAATVMVVFAAERYGLAQLHQLRGRIGRGQEPGFCYLVTPSGIAAGPLKRLKVLVDRSSGSEIAQADLELRGPGDLFGLRQAGPLPLKFAHWLRDLYTLETVRDVAGEWLANDPDLTGAESRGLRRAVHRALAAGAAGES